MLKKHGADTCLIERADRVGQSWREHYDRLQLHTTRQLSQLPDLPIPRSYGRWVSRLDFVSYLEHYARAHDLRTVFGTVVQGLTRNGKGWMVETSQGDIETDHVVVATGYNRLPFLPRWHGRERFEGQLIHSSDYRDAAPFRGKDVLVVGAGNTGAELVVDLVSGGAARVRMSVRTPPNILPRAVLGLPTQLLSVLMQRTAAEVADQLVEQAQRLTVGDLTPYGLPAPMRGVFTQVLRDGAVPVLDAGFVALLRQRRFEVVAALDRLDGKDVVLSDASRIQPDVVIAATGYRRGLEALCGSLGVLTADGTPLVHGPHTHENAPNLYFVGYSMVVTGILREIAIDARRVARTIADRTAQT